MVESSKVVAYCHSQDSIVADRPYMQIFALIPETGCLCLCIIIIIIIIALQQSACCDGGESGTQKRLKVS